MIVEPYAEDATEANHNPLGRLMYSASTLVCVPASLAQEVGAALGAQAGEKRLREVVTSGGFTRFRRATQMPFNLIFEAKRKRLRLLPHAVQRDEAARFSEPIYGSPFPDAAGE